MSIETIVNSIKQLLKTIFIVLAGLQGLGIFLICLGVFCIIIAIVHAVQRKRGHGPFSHWWVIGPHLIMITSFAGLTQFCVKALFFIDITKTIFSTLTFCFILLLSIRAFIRKKVILNKIMIVVSACFTLWHYLFFAKSFLASYSIPGMLIFYIAAYGLTFFVTLGFWRKRTDVPEFFRWKSVIFMISVTAFCTIVLPVLSSVLKIMPSANPGKIHETTDELSSIRTLSNRFYYNDRMLLDNIGSDEVSGDLSIASAALAAAAYDEEEIGEALFRMDYSFLYKSPYYEELSTHDNYNVVAYTVYEKYVNYNDELYRIIALPIRGTPSTCEWYGNFDIGLGEKHHGFYEAAKDVMANLKTYLETPAYEVDHTVIWTTGHSRGAAVANIIAGELSTASEWEPLVSKDCVFGYTYACPAVSHTADTSLGNIYNYNNGGDVIPALPLKDWGFTRFGKTIELPASEYENVCRRFKSGTGEDYKVSMTTYAWEGIIKDFAPTQADFVENDVVQLAIDIVSWSLGGYTDEEYTITDVISSHGNTGTMVLEGLMERVAYPKETLQYINESMDAARMQLMMNDDNNAYYELIKYLRKAISDTAEMSDVDSSDALNHMKYMEWTEWKDENRDELQKVYVLTGVTVETKEDLRTAENLTADLYEPYSNVAKTIEDVLSLFYDTEGNLIQPFTQGHSMLTYQIWLNSMYYGYMGWFDDQELKEVNWLGRGNTTYVGDYCFYGCDNLKSIVLPDEDIFIGEKALPDR